MTKQRSVKRTALRLALPLAVLFAAALLISALQLPADAFGIDPPFRVDGKSASSLAEAFSKAAETGSVITQDGKTSDFQTISSGIEVSKKVTLSLGKDDFNASVNRISYTGKNAPLFTITDGGVLTVKYSTFYGCDNPVNPLGGLFRVEKGGTLILNGTADEPVVISGSRLTAENAKGGAIYVEQGGRLIVNGATFAGNSADYGADIYAEQKTDVTVAKGVVVNADYGESVDINRLNLVLTGEIGLVFHTVVPEKYRGGSFVLASRTGGTVTYPISECGIDREDRILAKYPLSAIELSEPVTLAVCDENGDIITEKSISAEEYGRILLDDETVLEKEKDVARTLLNYGHFAQIECAENNGWVIGRDYAETAKYAELTADTGAFADYEIRISGNDPAVTDFGAALLLGYKTDLVLYFSSDSMPSVTVNGEKTDVEVYDLSDHRYRIAVREISALDLAQEFEIVINGKITLTISALSYCRLAAGNSGENNINAVRALYEFYLSTVKYNAKPTSPEEDTSL